MAKSKGFITQMLDPTSKKKYSILDNTKIKEKGFITQMLDPTSKKKYSINKIL